MKVFTYQCGRKFSDSDIPCLQFISEIRRIASHFILEAAMRKLLCLQLRPIFAANKPCFFHITTLANPRLLFRYLQKSLNKVLKVFVLSFSIYPQQNYFQSNGHSIDSIMANRVRHLDQRMT